MTYACLRLRVLFQLAAVRLGRFWQRLLCRLGLHAGYIDRAVYHCHFCSYTDAPDPEVHAAFLAALSPWDGCPHTQAALHQFPRVTPCTFCPDCGLVLLGDGTLTTLGAWFSEHPKEAR